MISSRKLVFAILWLLIACSCHSLGIRNPFAGKSLYERLGGISHIAVLVDEFVDKLMADEVIMSNPAVLEASERMPLAPLKYQITSLVCYATGGPESYTGRSLEEAHKGLNISEAEWVRMMEIFEETMDSLSIGEAEQAELLELVASTKSLILNR